VNTTKICSPSVIPNQPQGFTSLISLTPPMKNLSRRN
jgi:hypothetical protein